MVEKMSLKLCVHCKGPIQLEKTGIRYCENCTGLCHKCFEKPHGTNIGGYKLCRACYKELRKKYLNKPSYQARLELHKSVLNNAHIESMHEGEGYTDEGRFVVTLPHGIDKSIILGDPADDRSFFSSFPGYHWRNFKNKRI